jgi:hypothetical protein
MSAQSYRLIGFFMVVLLLLSGCSRQYGAYFIWSAVGAGLLAGAPQVVLVDSTLARINDVNLRLLAKKYHEPLSSTERDSLKQGLQLLSGHIAAGGAIDKKDRSQYRQVLKTLTIAPTSSKAIQANQWDYVALDQRSFLTQDLRQNMKPGSLLKQVAPDQIPENPLDWTEGKVLGHQALSESDPDDFYIEQLVAALLCIFVGFTGAHRFYLGYPKQGYIQLAWFVGTVLVYLLFYLLLQNAQRNGLDSWVVLGYVVFALLVLAIILLPLLIWIFVDLIRIMAGNLRKRPWPAKVSPSRQDAP